MRDLKTFITGLLRGGFRKYPPKAQVLKEASVGRKLNPKTNRQCEHFKCVICKEDFPRKGVNVDHINPVVDPQKGFTTWDSYISRMFCDRKGLQVLCGTCHDIKTLAETKVRTTTRKTKKAKGGL